MGFVNKEKQSALDRITYDCLDIAAWTTFIKEVFDVDVQNKDGCYKSMYQIIDECHRSLYGE